MMQTMKLAFFNSRSTPINSLASMKMICHKSKENHNSNKKLVNLAQNNPLFTKTPNLMFITFHSFSLRNQTKAMKLNKNRITQHQNQQ